MSEIILQRSFTNVCARNEMSLHQKRWEWYKSPTVNRLNVKHTKFTLLLCINICGHVKNWCGSWQKCLLFYYLNQNNLSSIISCQSLEHRREFFVHCLAGCYASSMAGSLDLIGHHHRTHTFALTHTHVQILFILDQVLARCDWTLKCCGQDARWRRRRASQYAYGFLFVCYTQKTSHGDQPQWCKVNNIPYVY